MTAISMSLPAACKAVGLPYTIAHSWVEQGIFRPAVPWRGAGRNCGSSVSRIQALALGVAAALRRRGVGVAAVKKVIAAIDHRGEDKLLAGFDQGLTHLILVGDEVFVGKRDANFEFSASGPTVVVSIDLSVCWQRMLAALAENAATNTKTKTKTKTEPVTAV